MGQNSIKLTLTLASFAVFAPIPSFAQPNAEELDYWHHGWSWGWSHIMIGSLMMVLFFGGLLALGILIIRLIGSRNSARKSVPNPPTTALDILHGRLARGEINEEQFQETKRVIMESKSAGDGEEREIIGAN